MKEQIISLNTIMIFGKYKGQLVDDIIPLINSEIDAKKLKEYVSYFAWIERDTQHSLSDQVKERIRHILNLIPIANQSDSYKPYYKPYYEHWNDIGSMTNISFQEVYGDFGY